jgi:hypothetical protein
MQSIINYFSNHPTHLVALTLGLNAVWSAFVGALPAPAATSGNGYVFFFKFMNTLAFNFHRAASTSIENSPNFLPAVEKYAANLGADQMAQIAQGEKAPPVPPKP